MDTLGSQAFGAGNIHQATDSEGNYELVGILLQNVLFLVTLAAIPVGILWGLTKGNEVN